MHTYILIRSPSRPKERGIHENESPAQEIADNIRNGNRALTAWGGWSIGTNWNQIQPGDRLLFYRSESPTGFFAVGRALSADDSECRKLRGDGLRERFPNVSGVDKLSGPVKSGAAAFTAAEWETGEGEVRYINAEWTVVASEAEEVLVPYDTQDLGVVRGSGFRIPDDKKADAICAECENAANALRANI